MSHIAIKLNGVYLATADNTAIDIEDANPYFNDQSETMSLPFTVPLDGNRAAFGNVECIENDDNLRSIENMRMDVEVDGILLRSGKAGSIEDQSLTDSVALQMVSAVYSLDDYLDGVRCRDVDLIDEIPIGETIGDIRIDYSCTVMAQLRLTYGGFQPMIAFGTSSDSVSNTVQLPALGFSRPEICKTVGGSTGFGDHSAFDSDGNIEKEPTIERSFINVTDSYPIKKYCNARVCYMHHDTEHDSDTDELVNSDNIQTVRDNTENGKFNPYLVLEANRPASGICFYILYFLDCLFARFKEDGIAYDNTELLKVDDLCRLVFFTTHCKFYTKLRSGYPTPHLRNAEQITSWLRTRNINTEVKVELSSDNLDFDSATIGSQTYKKGDKINIYADGDNDGWRTIDCVRFNVSELVTGLSANVMDMYASSMNFPDADAKTVIDSLWSSFGIRFYLDQQTRLVKPRFIRDILRNKEEAIVFPCKVISAHKRTEKVTGFRMQYSGQSDKQQREDNITLGLRDYDTVYDYQDYRNLDISLPYKDIVQQTYDTNMTCYVDMSTGNLYRIKIDGDAETRAEYHPVVFEVRQLGGVEIGDCSAENEDFIHEETSSFEPLIFNDVNFKQQQKFGSGGVNWNIKDSEGNNLAISFGAQQPVLAAFISEDMWHEDLARKIAYPVGDSHMDLNLVMTIKTKESFDVSSSDDGDSPLQSLDWGLAVAIMRGGGATAHLDYYDYNYDMFGNCKYRMVAGSDYGISIDSIDNYGQLYDYNGDLPGIGGDNDNIMPEQAASSIRRIFRSSNANLMSEARKLNAGNVQSVILNDIDGENYGYLMTTVKDDGTVLSATEFSNYINTLGEFSRAHNINIMALDSTLQDFRLIIGKYKDSIVAGEYRELLLQLANVYYSGEPGKITCPIPEGESIDYNSSADGRISLKIRSYIEAPEDMIGPKGEEIKKGTPLCNPQVKNRGLFDQFMSDYAYLRLHGKHVDIDVQCEVAALTNIQWHRRYRFGDYVGWINKIKTHITAANGIESVTVELLVL